MGKQTLVIVRVYRDIEYPKSMLNKAEPFRDAIFKAQDDMQGTINEIIQNDHDVPNLKMFKFEAREELGYKYRRDELAAAHPDNINIGIAAKALATRELEAKYGPLNHEQNPGIYVLEPEVRDPDGHLLRDATWYMRHDIENEFYNSYEVYRQLLRGANNK